MFVSSKFFPLSAPGPLLSFLFFGCHSTESPPVAAQSFGSVQCAVKWICGIGCQLDLWIRKLSTGYSDWIQRVPTKKNHTEPNRWMDDVGLCLAATSIRSKVMELDQTVMESGYKDFNHKDTRDFIDCPSIVNTAFSLLSHHPPVYPDLTQTLCKIGSNGLEPPHHVRLQPTTHPTALSLSSPTSEPMQTAPTGLRCRFIAGRRPHLSCSPHSHDQGLNSESLPQIPAAGPWPFPSPASC